MPAWVLRNRAMHAYQRARVWIPPTLVSCGERFKYMLISPFLTPVPSALARYDILGISRDASQTEIRKVFRALSIKYHPDKSDDPTAAQRFAVRMQEMSTVTNLCVFANIIFIFGMCLCCSNLFI